MNDGGRASDELKHEPLDRFALDLQRLREQAATSYTDLAQQVSAIRLARGMHEAAARTPRSTVYTCFSTGRARINTALLRDIVLALTNSETEAQHWVDRYLAARVQADAHRRLEAASPAANPTTQPRGSVSQTQPRGSALQPRPISWHAIVLVVVACALINRIGRDLNAHLGFGLFLDMIGTCIAAILLGPWWGVLVAMLHTGFSFIDHADIGVLFGLVNVTGALVWGYGVRRFSLGTTLMRFTALGVIAAAACTAVGVPINLFVSTMGQASGLDAAVQSLQSMGLPFAAAQFSANITTSVIDKVLASFIALVVVVMLHRRFAFNVSHMPLVEHLGEQRAAWSKPIAALA